MREPEQSKEELAAKLNSNQDRVSSELKVGTKRKWRTLVALSLGYFVDQGEHRPCPFSARFSGKSGGSPS
jgi:hypothetical protein